MVKSTTQQPKLENQWQPSEHAAAASAWFTKKYIRPDQKSSWGGNSSGLDNQKCAIENLPETQIVPTEEIKYSHERQRPPSRGRVLHQCTACKVLYTVSHFCPLKSNQLRHGLITSRPNSANYRPRSVEVSSIDSKKSKSRRHKDRPVSAPRPRSSCRARIYDPGPSPWAK